MSEIFAKAVDMVERRDAQIASLQARIKELEGAAQLRPIETPPQNPMPVLFYSAVRRMDVDLPNYRDERFDVGFWDGENWRWNGTGHLVWEWPEDEYSDDLPTHWLPLPTVKEKT